MTRDDNVQAIVEGLVKGGWSEESAIAALHLEYREILKSAAQTLAFASATAPDEEIPGLQFARDVFVHALGHLDEL